VVLEQGRELERRSRPRLGTRSKISNVKPPSMLPGVACASSRRAPDQNPPTERGQQALLWRRRRKQVVLEQGRAQEPKHLKPPVHCRLPIVLGLIRRLRTGPTNSGGKRARVGGIPRRVRFALAIRTFRSLWMRWSENLKHTSPSTRCSKPSSTRS
jgi:hypothetical protein